MNTLGLISSFAIFSHISTIFEMLPFIIQIFGLRYYIIQGDKDKIRLITKKLEKETISSSSRLTNGKTVPSNYFIGFKCIGYFDNTSRFSEDTKVYVITFKSHYDYLLQDKDISLDLNTIFIEDGIKIAEEKQVLLPEVKKNTGKIQMWRRAQVRQVISGQC